MEGGRYGLTRPLPGEANNRPHNGDEQLTAYGQITARNQADNAKACFPKALAIRPANPEAERGLTAAEELACAYMRAK